MSSMSLEYGKSELFTESDDQRINKVARDKISLRLCTYKED